MFYESVIFDNHLLSVIIVNVIHLKDKFHLASNTFKRLEFNIQCGL